MNKISKKLLLCALLVGGIIESNINAGTISDDTDLSGVANLFSDEEKRAERAAKKAAAEEDNIDYDTSSLYGEDASVGETEETAAIPTPPPLPASKADSKEESAVTKGARKRRKRVAGKSRKKAARSKSRSKSNRKGKEGSKFEKRRISRRKSFKKAKSTRKSRTARPRRQPKGVAQTADNQGRVKSWKSGHKKTQASRKKRFTPKTSAQRATIARRQAEKLLDKSPWTARDYKRAQSLRKTLDKLLPRPYSLADYKFFGELDAEISAYEGTPQEDSRFTRSIKRSGRRLKHVDAPVERTGYKLGKVVD
jgi:hypothetical protein